MQCDVHTKVYCSVQYRLSSWGLLEMLQFAASINIPCSWTCVLLPSAVHRNALQCTAVHRNALQRTAVHRNALQRIAVHRNALQRTAVHYIIMNMPALQCTSFLCTALHYKTLHWPALVCILLQFLWTVLLCSLLQYFKLHQCSKMISSVAQWPSHFAVFVVCPSEGDYQS